MSGDRKDNPRGVRSLFDLTGRVIVITGGAGMLGRSHVEAVSEMGGVPVILDISGSKAQSTAQEMSARFGTSALGLQCDITDETAVQEARSAVLAQFGVVHGLINNAANNPKVESGRSDWGRLENLPLEIWKADLAVGLTGSLLCARTFGSEMARRSGGVIINVASDLALIGPDQRIYRIEGTLEELQPVKPVSYSVVKSGLLGLTRYLATYWAGKNVRVNAICPGGVFDDQDAAFTDRLTNLIPLGRMANADEYQATIVYLLSDASSYMTGAVIPIDGGRTAW
jgi:NAD(P)-dependent dehydrogenase (short-subunit alcohol dehydrogenase family)